MEVIDTFAWSSSPQENSKKEHVTPGFRGRSKAQMRYSQVDLVRWDELATLGRDLSREARKT